MCVLLKRGRGHLDFLVQWIGEDIVSTILATSYANQGTGLIVIEIKKKKKLDLKYNLDFKTMIYLGLFLERGKWTTNFKCGQQGHNSKHISFILYCWIYPFLPNPINVYFLSDSCQSVWREVALRSAWETEETQMRFLIVATLPTQFTKSQGCLLQISSRPQTSWGWAWL